MTRLPLRGTSQAASAGFLSGSLLLSLLCLLKFLIFPLTRSGRAGPLLSGQQKVGKDWPKRAAPPLGFPLCGRARVPSAQPREGSDGTPSRCAAGASGRFAKASPQKPFRTRYHALSRMTGRRSLWGTQGGKGAQPPPRSGGGAAAVASAHALALSPTAPKLQPRKRRGVRPIRIAQRDLGVSKGGRPAPHFGPGIRKGVKLPCACLCLLSAGAESRGPRAARARRRKKL